MRLMHMSSWWLAGFSVSSPLVFFVFVFVFRVLFSRRSRMALPAFPLSVLS